MNHEELKEHMDERFNHLEDKFDEYAKQTHINTTNISWIKGSIKWSAAFTATLITAIIGAIATIFTK